MTTKSSKNSSKKHKSASKTQVRTAPARTKTIRECLSESEVLHFHMKIITVLSVVICVLVVALIFVLMND